MQHRAAVRLRTSVYYDSVTTRYRYTYELQNRSSDASRVIGFALIGAVTVVQPRPTYTEVVVQERGRPAHWNAFLGCGGRRDVLGWMIWEMDPKGSLFGHAVKPGRYLEPMSFESPLPPGRVRWVADTARSSEVEPASAGCSLSRSADLEALPLTGWTVGPVER
jgi:hypothetical protein